LLSHFKNIRKEGSFVKNAFITISWNGAIIVIQLLLSPVITRLYDPGEYGIFALFNSIVMNLALVGSLRYTEAIVIAENEEERTDLISLVLLLVTGVGVVTLITLFIFYKEIALFLNLKGAAEILFLIPFSFFLSSVIELLVNIHVHRKKFLRNGFAGFVLNSGSRVSSIAYAVMMTGRSGGLIIGDFVGKVACLLSLTLFPGKRNDDQKPFLSAVIRPSVGLVAKKYRSFSLYYLPSQLLVSFSGHIPLYFFQWVYGATMVGAYAFAASLLDMFNRLVPYSLGPVLLKKASDLKNISHDLLCDRVYKLFLVMLGAGTVIYSGFALLGRIVLPFVFGSSWELTGIFSGILAVSFTFGFVASALSEVYNVLKRQRFLLVNTFLTILLKAVAIILIIQWKMDARHGLMLYSGLSSIGGLFLVLGIFVILKFKVAQVLGWLLLSLGVLSGAFFIGGLL
jgi:O-antigen/teichoic acid export membrane protein